MYAQGDGDRTIRLYDQSNQVVDEVTVFLNDGENVVNLNIDIPVIGKYSLANMSENLYRNNGGANYPYDVDNLLSIYSSNATNDELNYYYYFYDWIVQEALCQSQAVEVAVVVAPGPVAGFLADAVGLTTSFTDISSGDPVARIWDFGDGSPVSTEQNPLHTFPAEGVYTVELTVTNGTCFSATQQTLEVGNISATNETADAFGLNLYPNPATDEVQLEIRQAYNDKMQLLVTNATGRAVLSRSLQGGVSRYSINTSSLSVRYVSVPGHRRCGCICAQSNHHQVSPSVNRNKKATLLQGGFFIYLHRTCPLNTFFVAMPVYLQQAAGHQAK
jgi:PKD repeat protein